jgi:RNA polymerase sigma-70 factor (ECF subfamily)
MTQIDNSIITRSQAGDKDAFRSLVETCQGMVFSVALKMLAGEEEAKDVVQETFLRVWLNISKFDARRSFTTWLYAIASRLCLDHLKSRTHVIAMPEDESVLRRYASADGQRELENREWVAIVRLLAEGLSPKQRLVFTLSQLEGLSSQEVEDATGMTSKQVKNNLYVARQNIRERLKKIGYE